MLEEQERSIDNEKGDKIFINIVRDLHKYMSKIREYLCKEEHK